MSLNLLRFSSKKSVFEKNFSQYYSSEYVFDPKTIERTIVNFKELPPRRVSSNESLTKAAVFIPLCEVNNKVSLLYTLRAPHLKAFRGEVSFPGGKHDSVDETFIDTAVRETVEELGLDVNRLQIWDCGRWISTKKGFSVVPVFGHIKNNLNLQDLKVNTSEVQEVFTVALEDLCRPNNLGYTQFRTSPSNSFASVPVFLSEKHKIWGLTGFLTFLFLKCLLPKKAYSHPIKFVPSVLSNTEKFRL